MDDYYRQCPLRSAGFSLVTFHELPPTVFGPDGKCVCTRADDCRDRHKKHDGRCTISHLERLDREAVSRRAWQSGEDY